MDLTAAKKLREVLRLRFELHLNHRRIPRSRSISVSTVHDYLKRAETAGAGRLERRAPARYVTLRLLWEEYRSINPNGYRYSRY